MKVCRVVGKADASLKEPGLQGVKLLLVQEVDSSVKAHGPLILAVDTKGAGLGEIVGVVTGSSAVRSVGKGDVPYDAVIVAILDHLFVDGRQVYNKDRED